MESKKINQLATELAPELSDLTIIGDPTTGISKKITLSQMASLFTGTVEEYASLSAFPLVGAADTIYIALDTNIIYRWNTGTSAYVELSPNIVTSLIFNDANGFDGTISLVGSTATLTITTALTTGSVGFIGASGALLEDNTNFFWNNSNKRLGINTNAPTTALDVFGSGIIGRVNGTSTNNAFIGFASAGTNKWSIGNVQSDHRFRIYSEANTSELVSVLQTGEFGIGIANPTTKLHIDGGASALIMNLDADTSIAKSISFRTNNSNRWNVEVSGTESGSNAGMDYFVRSYSDVGVLIETPLSIVRSTGVTTIKSLTLTNALNAANGGTGITSYTIGDLIYASGTTTLAKLADVATGNALISGGVGVAPLWGKIGLTTHVDGTLPVANGGTGATTFTAGRVLFGNGTSALNTSANLFWDNTNTRLGIGNSSPSYTLDVTGTGRFTGALTGTSATFSSTAYTNLTLNGTNATGWGNNIAFQSGGTDFGYIGSIGSLLGNTTKDMTIWATSGNGFRVYTNGNNKQLEIASTGAATFSSSVAANGGNSTAANNTITGFTADLYAVAIRQKGASAGISGANYMAQIISAAGAEGLEIYTPNSKELILGTNATERMRIISGGYTKISNTGTYYSSTGLYHELRTNRQDEYTAFITNTNATSPYGIYIAYENATPNGTTNHFLVAADTSGLKFKVTSNGNCYNVTGTYTSGVSDIRYKEQITDANSQWNDIKNLRVVNFKFKKDVEENGDNALRHIGFIAQEVEQVSPNLIDEMSDEKTGETWKTIKASIINIKAIKALQEAMTKIEELSAQNQEQNQLIQELRIDIELLKNK